MTNGNNNAIIIKPYEGVVGAVSPAQYVNILTVTVWHTLIYETRAQSGAWSLFFYKERDPSVNMRSFFLRKISSNETDKIKDK